MDIHVPENLQPIPITPGVYKAQISGHKLSMSEAKPGKESKPMINVEYTILTMGPNPQENTIGRKIFENVVVSEATLWKVDILIRAATGKGIPKGDYKIDEFLGLLTSLIEGKEVMLRIDIEPRKDKTGKVVEGQFKNVVKETKAVAA